MKAGILAVVALLAAFTAQAQRYTPHDATAIEGGNDVALALRGADSGEADTGSVPGTGLQMSPEKTSGSVTALCPQGMLKITVENERGKVILHTDMKGEDHFSFDVRQPGYYRVNVVDKTGQMQHASFIRTPDGAPGDHTPISAPNELQRSMVASEQGGQHLRMDPEKTNGSVTALCPQGMLRITVEDERGRVVLHTDLRGEDHFSFDVRQAGYYRVNVVDKAGRIQHAGFFRTPDTTPVDQTPVSASNEAQRSMVASEQGGQHLRMDPEKTNGSVTALCPQGMLRITVEDERGRVVLHTDLRGEDHFSFDVRQAGYYRVNVVDKAGRIQHAGFFRTPDTAPVGHTPVSASNGAQRSMVASEQGGQHLKMFPVPTDGAVTAYCREGIQSLEVRNMKGTIVLKVKPNGNTRYSFDIVNRGSYIVVVVDNKGRTQRSRFFRN